MTHRQKAVDLIAKDLREEGSGRSDQHELHGVTLNPDAAPSPNARATEPILGARLVTTASVPADRRLAFWRELVCQTIAGVEARPLTSRRSYDGRILSRSLHLQDFRHF